MELRSAGCRARHRLAFGALLALIVFGLPGQATLADLPTGPVKIAGQIKEPLKVRTVAPKYPPDARRAGLAGVVILECTIDPDGKVTDTKALRGVPPLTDAAIEAVAQWRYTPTLLDGVAVPVIMTVTVNFKMEEVRYHDLLGSLDHRNENIREAASRSLGNLRVARGVDKGDLRKAIRELERVAVKDESPIVREAAARALSRLDGRPLPPPGPPPPRRSEPHARPVAWGMFVDPLGQCDITAHHDRIEIGVPLGAYDLSIELGQTTAPRVMQHVAGDLVARVTVDELPEPAAPAAGQPRRAYRGAGLLLWQELLIDSEGRVARSRVLQSVPGLDEAALACVQMWKFRPAVKGGQPVPTIAHAPVSFRLE